LRADIVLIFMGFAARGADMQNITGSVRGFGLLWSLNLDRLLFPAAIAGALYAAAFVFSA